MEMEKDLVTLINGGYKMEAVKMLRLNYSVDLMTAKKMVDDWEVEHRLQSNNQKELMN